MKKISYLFLLFTMAGLTLQSCKKREGYVTVKQGVTFGENTSYVINPIAGAKVSEIVICETNFMDAERGKVEVNGEQESNYITEFNWDGVWLHNIWISDFSGLGNSNDLDVIESEIDHVDLLIRDPYNVGKDRILTTASTFEGMNLKGKRVLMSDFAQLYPEFKIIFRTYFIDVAPEETRAIRINTSFAMEYDYKTQRRK